MRRKSNWQLGLGLVILSGTTILKQYVVLPEFVYGLCYGLSIFLELYGLLAMKHDMTKLRCFKRKLIGLEEKK